MNDWRPQTWAVRAQAEESTHHEHSVPIFLTSSFVFEDSEEMRAAFAGEIDRNVYARFTNPNVEELSEKIRAWRVPRAGHSPGYRHGCRVRDVRSAALERDHILACRSLFGSTHTILTKILPRFGITHTYVDAADPDSWPDEIRENTRMIFVETPTNPAVDLVDLRWLGGLAAERASFWSWTTVSLHRSCSGLSSSALTSRSTPPPSTSTDRAG